MRMKKRMVLRRAKRMTIHTKPVKRYFTSALWYFSGVGIRIKYTVEI